MAQMATPLRTSQPGPAACLLRGRTAARRAGSRAPGAGGRRVWAAAGADLSPDRLAFAMQRQVADAHKAEAARKARTPPSAGGAASAVPPRKAGRREARARAAAEAAAGAAAARQHSEAAQARLRERAAADLDADTLTSALRVQLQQSGTFDEMEHFVPGSGGSGGNGHTNGHGGAVGMRAAAGPAAFSQDRTLLYTADRQESVAVEDILTA